MTHAVLERRQFLQAGVAVGLAFRSDAGLAGSAPVPIIVHRDPACGCCGEWVKYLAASGRFRPTVRIEPDMTPIKARLGVPPPLASCHTARVGTYVIEGHVPVDDIMKLLRDRPANVLGLAVPGMVPGSPGMEVPGVSAPYAVIAFDRAGRTRTFSTYTGKPPRA